MPQSKRSYVNFDYNEYFILKVNSKKKSKSLVAKGEESEEIEKSMFQQALEKYKPQATTFKVGERAQADKFTPKKNNLAQPKVYSEPAKSFDVECEGVYIIIKGF